MTIDYATHKLTVGRHLPDEKSEFTLPMRHHRLSMVRGLINEKRPTYFVVDTGGEVISISTATAEATQPATCRAQDRPARLRDVRLGSRRVPDARASTCKFNDIDYKNFSVVVLNLQAPSVLLGFEVGGIVGHKFLSPYRVSLDLDRSELRMSKSGN